MNEPAATGEEQATLTDLEEAVVRAVRDGKEPDEVRQEVEAALHLTGLLKGWGPGRA